MPSWRGGVDFAVVMKVVMVLVTAAGTGESLIFQCTVYMGIVELSRKPGSCRWLEVARKQGSFYK